MNFYMLYYVMLSLRLISKFISNAKVLTLKTYINNTLLAYLFKFCFITVLLLVKLYDMDYYKDKYIELLLGRYGLFNIFSSIHYFSGEFDSNTFKSKNNAYMISYLIKVEYIKLYFCLYFKVEIWNDGYLYFGKIISGYYELFFPCYIYA